MLIVQAKPGTAAAIDELRAVLRQQRHVTLDKPDNFFISTADRWWTSFTR